MVIWHRSDRISDFGVTTYTERPDYERGWKGWVLRKMTEDITNGIINEKHLYHYMNKFWSTQPPPLPISLGLPFLKYVCIRVNTHPTPPTTSTNHRLYPMYALSWFQTSNHSKSLTKTVGLQTPKIGHAKNVFYTPYYSTSFPMKSDVLTYFPMRIF